MKFQPTIANQGLLLITIPLIFEIIFVISLWTTLRQIDAQRQDIARSREFVAEVIDLTKSFLDAGICLGAWKTTRSDEFSHQYDSILVNVPDIYKRLTVLSGTDPQRQHHVEALKVNGKQILDLISGFRKPTGIAMLVLMDPVEYRHKLTAAYQGFFSETGAISREEKERQNLSPAVEEKQRQLLSLILLAGVTINIFISLAMVRFFSNKITRRLSILTDNCRRFVDRRNLNHLVGGQDEIADLDVHIHDMADEVRNAEQKRDEYVQMVNHDLRAPLAAIQTILAGTAKGLYGELTEKGQSRIADAREDASRLVDLINETMEADRLESGQFQLQRDDFDLGELIANVTSSLRPLMEQKNMELALTPIEAQVNGDRPRLRRVLTNLIDNAIKYAPADSKIEIAISRQPREVEVEIRDEGPGVKPGEEDRVFQAYDRGSEAHALAKPGKGLGLAICKVIIEAHGGRIGVKNKTDGGSIFWFVLPIV